eukprot:Skav207072  [mRNA]  locus=scaffold1909:191240:196597:- [translate_table: standard]
MVIPQPLPLPLQKMLERFDLTKSPRVDHLGNFALRNFVPLIVEGGTLIEGEIFDHGSLASNFMLGSSGRQCIDNIVGHKVRLDVDDTTRLRIFRAREVYVHQAKVVTTDPILIRSTDETLILPLTEDERDIMHTHTWVAELFCGGYGGWQQAFEFLQQFGAPSFRTIAVDSSTEAVIQYALTHAFQIVHDPSSLHADFLHQFPFDTVIRDDIKSPQWQQCLQWLYAKYWTISAPCQSWSGAGHGAGFDNADGMSMAHALSACKIHRPRYVGLEQVEGMVNHAHFPVFLALVKWAGYRFVNADVKEIAAFVPVRRRRWLALLVRDDVQLDDFQPQAWPLGTVSPNRFDTLLVLDDSELPNFQPSPTEAAVYFDPKYLPPFCKARDRAAVTNYRLPPLTEPFPTVMAAYTQQHLLNKQDLQARGLMGFFVKQNSPSQGPTFRYVHPAEVLLMHGQIKTVMLLKPAPLTYRSLGNMIAPLHAISVLLELLQSDKIMTSNLKFQDVAASLLEQRLKASQLQVEHNECAWFVGVPEHIGKLKNHLAFFMDELQWKPHADNSWPVGFFFHPEQGLLSFDGKSKPPQMHQISPTLAMQLTAEFQLALIPGEYGTYKVDAALTWEQLQPLWNQRLKPMNIANYRDDLPFESTWPELKMIMLPTDNFEVPIPTDIPILLREDDMLHIYEPLKGTHWSEYATRCMLPDQKYYDAFGKLETDEVNIFGEVTSVWEPPLPIDQFLAILPDILQVMITPAILPNTDILAMDCSGPPGSKDAFLKLWNSQDLQQWLSHKGRQTNFVDMDDHTWRLLMRPKLPVTATPVKILVEELFVRILHVMVSSLKQVPGLDCVIHHRQRTLAHTILPPDMEFRMLQAIVIHAGQCRLFSEPSIAPENNDELRATDPLRNLATFDAQPIPFSIDCIPKGDYDTGSETDECMESASPAASDEEPTTPDETCPWTPLELFQVTKVVNRDPYTHQCQVVMQASQASLDHIQQVWCSHDIHSLLQTFGVPHVLTRTHQQIKVVLQLATLTLEQQCTFDTMLFHALAAKSFVLLHRDATHSVIIKQAGVCFAQVAINPDDDLGKIEAVLHLWWHWISPNHASHMGPRMIATGKQCWAHTEFDLLLQRTRDAKPPKIHLVGALHGGGPTQKPTAKQDFQKMVETGVAALLMEFDIPLPQVPTLVTKIIQHAGFPKLHDLLQMSHTPAKFKDFGQLCKTAGVDLPARGPIRSKTTGKFQKLKDQQTQRTLLQPDPTMFKLTPGFFCNADGSVANVLTGFSPQSSGVLLAKAEDAQLWIKSMVTKPIDELGVYVLGAIDVPSQFPTMQVDAPATDNQGRNLILRGLLIQFGSRNLQTSAMKLQDFETEEIQIASVTLWKKDYDEDTWERILAAPVKTVQHLLSLEGLGGILGQPWGRAFHNEGVSVSPHLASSVQFHATFQVGPRFTALLRRSGFSKIYLCPKDDQGMPDKRWKVIWLPTTTNVLELESQANSIAGAAGLVTAKKGLGLRVDTTNFAKAWATLKPDSEVPDHATFKWRFKLHPLPLGVSAETLKQWAQQNFDWAIRPLKSSGARQWLIAADSIPDKILTFNGQPLLLQQLPDKGLKSSSTISAGPKYFPNKEIKDKTAKENIFKTGDPFLDPWKQATTGTAVMSDGAKPATQNQEQKPLTGPFAARMEQQDARLQAVETMVSQMKETTAAKVATLEQHQLAIQQTMTNHMQKTEQGFEHVHREQLSTQRTLAEAIASQEQRMQSNFAELKQIFLANRGTKRAAKNQAKKDHNGEDSDVEISEVEK